jgi:hypothetical protein
MVEGRGGGFFGGFAPFEYPISCLAPPKIPIPSAYDVREVYLI